MTGERTASSAQSEYPVLILMRREEATQGQWRYSRWTLQGVLADNPVKEAGPITCRQVHSVGDCADYLWTGFRVPLYKDAAESYWFNLTSTNPSLFVICRPGAELDLEPCLVTLDHDQAGAMMEADERVFEAPIPDALRPWLERFIVQYYRPGPRKKRKREDWKAP